VCNCAAAGPGTLLAKIRNIRGQNPQPEIEICLKGSVGIIEERGFAWKLVLVRDTTRWFSLTVPFGLRLAYVQLRFRHRMWRQKNRGCSGSDVQLHAARRCARAVETHVFRADGLTEAACATPSTSGRIDNPGRTRRCGAVVLHHPVTRSARDLFAVRIDHENAGTVERAYVRFAVLVQNNIAVDEAAHSVSHRVDGACPLRAI
jgi:hypothetical protein